MVWYELLLICIWILFVFCYCFYKYEVSSASNFRNSHTKNEPFLQHTFFLWILCILPRDTPFQGATAAAMTRREEFFWVGPSPATVHREEISRSGTPLTPINKNRNFRILHYMAFGSLSIGMLLLPQGSLRNPATERLIFSFVFFFFVLICLLNMFISHLFFVRTFSKVSLTSSEVLIKIPDKKNELQVNL